MFSPCRAERLRLIAIACLLIWRSVDAAAFTVCAEPDNLPFSSREQGGFEIAAANLVAEELGQPLEVRWVAQRLPDFLRVTIDAGICDAVMSVPRDSHRLATTGAWYRTTFVFVSRIAPLPTGFDDPRLKGWSIAVPMVADGGGTPPALALMQRGLLDQLRPYSALESERMIGAVRDGTVDLAVLWGPFAGWYVAKSNAQLLVGPTPARDGTTPFTFGMAMGVRRGRDDLRDALDTALARRAAGIAQVLARWRVPLVAGPGG
jgi:mxaJ protein